VPAGEWQALLEQTDVTMSVSALSDTQIFGGQYMLDHTTVRRKGATTTTEIETPKGLLRMRQV
jgi:hypothetical protein